MSCNSCCNDSKSGANLPVSINFGDNDFYIIYNPSNRRIEKVQKTNSGGPFLSQENNLSDVQSAEESRANLQVYGTDETLTKDEIQEFIRPIILIPKPSGFDYLPFDVVKYSDTVYLSNTDWLEMFKTKYAGFIGAGEVYVSQSLGDDSGTGSKAQPFQTINAAMEANASTVYILDGVFDDFLDFRDTSTQGAKAKIIIGVGENITFKQSGDDLQSLSFAENATYSNVYDAVLTTSNNINRLLRSDIIDEDNRDTPIPKRSSVLEVNSTGNGWYYDTGTNTLSVRIHTPPLGTVPEREAWFNDNVKPLLTPLYIGTSASTQRFYFQNTKVFLKNITIEGAHLFSNNTGSESLVPVLWTENIQVLYPAVAGGVTIEGAESFAKDVYVTRSNGDNFGYHIENTVEATAIEYNVKSTYAGDVDTFPTTSANKNASSMHEDGTIARFGGEYNYSYPYNIVDTGLSGTSQGGSWNVGCKSKGASAIDIIMFDRTVYLDHLVAGTIRADVNSTIIYNDLVVNVLDSVSNGVLTEYELTQ